MNKKRAGLFFGVFLLLILGVSFVSAQDEVVQGFQKFWQGLIDILDVIAKPIFGSSAIDGMAAGEVLFVKVLLFVIILAIVWSILNIIPLLQESTWAVAVISIAVSVLTTRFLATPGWISTILLPYSVFGIAVSSFFPLVLYFYFIEKIIGDKPTLRKAAWIFAGVVFVGLFISRVSDVASNVPAGKFNPAWIYLITAIVCLIFFIADNTIRRYFLKAAFQSKLSKTDITLLKAQRDDEINKIEESMKKGDTTAADGRHAIEDIKKRYEAIIEARTS